jgi:uncharacterized membrane protein
LWILAFLAAAGFSYFIPPMQSPDEMSHIERAYLISKGRFFLEKLPPVLVNGPRKYAEDAAFMERARQHGGPIGGMVDQGLLQYIAFNFELVLDYNRRFSDSENNQISKIKWASNEEYHLLPGAGYYFPAIYTPQALGFSIGRLFDLNVGNSYYLARGLVLAACFALFWLASRLLTPNPLAVAILFLPMSMFQMLSPTIDGLTTALAVLACSLFMAAADLSRGHPRFSSWGLALCVFILATARTHTLPLLVLPFYIAWVRRSPRDLYLGCTATAATLGWVLYAMNSTNDPRVARSHTSAELLFYYLSNPTAFFEVVSASLSNPTLFTFYQESFIGILGWLDTKLPHYFYPTLWLGLAICALVGVSWHTLQRDWFPRLLLIGVALTSVCLIFLALLLTWTPHPTSLVQGVQGRYFVVPMILLAYSVSGFAVFRGPTHRVLTWVVLAGFALTALTALMMALFSRYGSAAVS